MSAHLSRRVLIVEDDGDIRDAIAELLADNDYSPVAAANGQDALAQLQKADEKPCVILLDLMMPVMDGWAFRAAQRANPDLQDIPIVVLSANLDAARTSHLNAT